MLNTNQTGFISNHGPLGMHIFRRFRIWNTELSWCPRLSRGRGTHICKLLVLLNKKSEGGLKHAGVVEGNRRIPPRAHIPSLQVQIITYNFTCWNSTYKSERAIDSERRTPLGLARPGFERVTPKLRFLLSQGPKILPDTKNGTLRTQAPFFDKFLRRRKKLQEMYYYCSSQMQRGRKEDQPRKEPRVCVERARKKATLNNSKGSGAHVICAQREIL